MQKKLTLVATPIGNLKDITLKALDKLTEADLILCEDTRVTRKLLELLSIDQKSKRVMSFHEHSDPNYLNKFSENEEIVYVSDAGSPIVSDPASKIVLWAKENNRKIESCSGISSVINALEISGLSVNSFSFHGFLPRTQNKQNEVFEKIQSIEGVHVFFESPNRILKTLGFMEAYFQENKIVLTRELTKKFESVYSIDLKSDWKKNLPENLKGECVLLIKIEKTKSVSNKEIEKLALGVLNKSNPKNISKLLAKILDRDSKEVYKELID